LSITGLFPSTRLAHEGKKDALNFLRKHYQPALPFIIRGLAQANNFEEYSRMLASCTDEEEKMELFENVIRGLAYSGFVDEIKLHTMALSMQSDSLRKYRVLQSGKVLGYSFSNKVNVVRDIIDNETDDEDKRHLQSLAVFGMGVCGNLKTIVEFIKTAIDHKHITILYHEAIRGLVRGRHFVELQDLVNSAPAEQRNEFLATIASESADCYQINNINIMLECVDAHNHKALFKAVLDGFIRTALHNAAYDLLTLAEDKEERLLVLEALSAVYIRDEMYAENLRTLIESISNPEEVTFVLTQNIKYLLNQGCVDKVEAFLTNPKFKADNILILTKLMIYYAEQADQPKINEILSRNKNQKARPQLIEALFCGYIIGNKSAEMILYIATLKKDRRVEAIKQTVNAHFKLYSQADDELKQRLAGRDLLCAAFEILASISDVKDLEIIGKFILKKYINMEKYSRVPWLIRQIAHVKLNIEFTHYVLYEYARVNNSLQIGEILAKLVDNKSISKMLPSVVRGLVDGNHFRAAIEYVDNLKTPADKLSMRFILVCSISKAKQIVLLSEVLSEVRDLSELTKLIEEAIDRKNLYQAPCFETPAKATESLASINDEMIRKLITVQLVKEKESADFSCELLLPAAARNNKLLKNVVFHFSNRDAFFKASEGRGVVICEETETLSVGTPTISPINSY
jgi:hypothetical protein